MKNQGPPVVGLSKLLKKEFGSDLMKPPRGCHFIVVLKPGSQARRRAAFESKATKL